MTQVHALLVLSVVQFVTVNAICKSCQNDEDCVDFCNDTHAKSVCENKFLNDSQSKCCVCKGRVRRHGPVHSGWSTWSTWSGCSGTCGTGITSRQRHCSSPPCDGHPSEAKHCHHHTACAAVDGGWSGWHTWGRCSAGCGSGVQTRIRSCNNPRPEYGGRSCPGHGKETQSCHMQPCPVNGGWTDWTAWRSCSHTCGEGTSIRTRTCSNPVPQHGGHPCQGHSDDSKACNNGPCPVDGGWSDWTAWHSCSHTCGGGTSIRARTCSNPVPLQGGHHCQGQAEDSKVCNNGPCPGLDCPFCDDSLNCVFNNTCDSSETCMIRTYEQTQPSVHCSKKEDCTFVQTILPNSEIYCCDDRDCIRQYLGV